MKTLLLASCLFLVAAYQPIRADEIDASDPVTLSSYKKKYPGHEINLWILVFRPMKVQAHV